MTNNIQLIDDETFDTVAGMIMNGIRFVNGGTIPYECFEEMQSSDIVATVYVLKILNHMCYKGRDLRKNELPNGVKIAAANGATRKEFLEALHLIKDNIDTDIIKRIVKGKKDHIPLLNFFSRFIIEVELIVMQEQ